MTTLAIAEDSTQENSSLSVPVNSHNKDFSSISSLLCGAKVSPDSDIDEILNYLFDSIEKICTEISKLESMPDEHITLYGPFLGRSLLELGSTALIARLDPFRVLILREAQKQPDYDLGKPNSASIRWQGDVLADDVSELWKDKSLKSPTRALLGVYQRHFLTKTMDRMIDELNDHGNGEWANKLTGRPLEGLAHYILQEITKLYSSLSKGIHHELIIPAESILDRDTVVTLLNNVLHVMASIGLMTSFVPHIYKNGQNKHTLIQKYNTSEFLEIN